MLEPTFCNLKKGQAYLYSLLHLPLPTHLFNQTVRRHACLPASSWRLSSKDREGGFLSVRGFTLLHQPFEDQDLSSDLCNWLPLQSLVVEEPSSTFKLSRPGSLISRMILFVVGFFPKKQHNLHSYLHSIKVSPWAFQCLRDRRYWLQYSIPLAWSPYKHREVYLDISLDEHFQR